MAQITFDLSGTKATDVKKIVIYSKDKSQELATVQVTDGKIESGEPHTIDATEVYVVVIYKGLLNNVGKKHYYDVKIIGNGTLVIGADGEGNSRVNYRG
ncbi:hypothetical protein J0X12_08145 [Sneathiella sp. CAU 1612]|uniref:Uncharacterized protein n=1 Tax=Sneathiella sedimenti TaxID=2816034 RepID=A0ABS3F5A7_9PROT|nr:hypothetical protein [Sneathiella sedimenti]MBO0333579.1 hypothetical protein [Sneathiella sedimenti]